MCDSKTKKPLLRGVIHGIAFICILASTISFIIASIYLYFNVSVLIYMLSQLLQFGVSSVYHIPPWPPKIKHILQLIDHISIFILISGTQTSVLRINSRTREHPLANAAIRLSWTISIIGILKILLTNKLHNIFDLVVYILHGASVVPFYRVIMVAELFDRILIFLGGFLYIFGGVIYGLERPNLHPRIFGYHELFHVFTILANGCFAILVTKHYFKGLK